MRRLCLQNPRRRWDRGRGEQQGDSNFIPEIILPAASEGGDSVLAIEIQKYQQSCSTGTSTMLYLTLDSANTQLC